MAKLVLVRRFFDLEEAVCVRALLLARGYFVYLQNEHHLSVDPALRVALGGYGLWTISDEFVAASRELNEAVPLEIGQDKRTDTFEDETRKTVTWIWLPVMVAFMFPFTLKHGSRGEKRLQYAVSLFLCVVIFIAIGSHIYMFFRLRG